MKVTQVYEILNTIAKEMLGESVIVNEDLSNIVEVGKAFENLDNGYDNYVKKLHDQIGKMVFVNRVYNGRAPKVVMDGWEFGSILCKVRADLPDAVANESWELEDNTSYDPFIFKKPNISAKFYDGKVAFEIQVSITEKQIKSSFSNATQLNAFYSMIETAIENKITMNMDALIMRTINAAIGETIYDEYGAAAYGTKSGVRAVNLLYLYNQIATTPITAEDAITDPDFIRFASYTIKNYIGRLQDMSKLFNLGGTAKFTSKDAMKIVLLNDFKNAAEVYLYDGLNQFNTDGIRLPQADGVSYWQGEGTGYSYDDITSIDVVTPSGHTVATDGILGVIFDRETLGVANLDRRVTNMYNPKAEFWNEFHKFDAGFYLDLDSNFVVFFVSDDDGN